MQGNLKDSPIFVTSHHHDLPVAIAVASSKVYTIVRNVVTVVPPYEGVVVAVCVCFTTAVGGCICF